MTHFSRFFDIFENRIRMVPNGVFRPHESEFAVENRFGYNFHYENPKLLFADLDLVCGFLCPMARSKGMR